jgi:hypothetical protein
MNEKVRDPGAQPRVSVIVFRGAEASARDFCSRGKIGVEVVRGCGGC